MPTPPATQPYPQVLTPQVVEPRIDGNFPDSTRTLETTLTVDYAGLNPDSPLPYQFSSGIVIGDKIRFNQVTDDGYTVEVDTDGLFRILDAPTGQNYVTHYWHLQASAGFAPSTELEFTINA
jgi:hypothetical protein